MRTIPKTLKCFTDERHLYSTNVIKYRFSYFASNLLPVLLPNFLRYFLSCLIQLTHFNGDYYI